MKSLLFTLYFIHLSSLHAEQSVGDIQISRLDYTPIRISIITEFSSNKMLQVQSQKRFSAIATLFSYSMQKILCWP